MFVNEIQIRVPYADTDQMGYVYYGNYAKYYEMARVESLRNIGFNYKNMEADGVMMPVVENHSYYHAPAGYDEMLTIRVFVKAMPTVKMNFEYEIYNEENKKIHTGATTLVFMNRDTRRPCRAPEEVMKAMKTYFEK